MWMLQGKKRKEHTWECREDSLFSFPSAITPRLPVDSAPFLMNTDLCRRILHNDVGVIVCNVNVPVGIHDETLRLNVYLACQCFALARCQIQTNQCVNRGFEVDH